MNLHELQAGRSGASGSVMLFACSPRKGGNSDTAVRAFARGIEDAGGTSRIVYLRDKVIFPCRGCSVCVRTGRCVLAAEDDAESLFDALQQAPFLFFAAPIYFYHLPALFKGFIDRAQSRYVCSLQQERRPDACSPRRAYVSLCAGRSRGARLFEGSLLTLKYFLDVFGFSLQDPVLFRSMDGPGDLAADEVACDTVRSLGREAWMNVRK